MDKNQPKIVVCEGAGFFNIIVDGKSFHYDQEDNLKGMIELFKHLGFKDVKYEEVY